jgi:DNA-binding transcriptional LysR family regulator
MSFDDTLAFVSVARAGGFTRAGRALRVPKATLSRRVQRLEERLGLRLLQRTTRKLGLTEAGRAYYERCLHAVEQIEDAERVAANVSAAPRGTLRVSASLDFGRDYLAGWLADFRQRYPEVHLSLELTQRRVDLVAEGFDVALRAGARLEDANLVARKLFDSALVLCASPRYLRKRGTPKTLSDLGSHDGVMFGPGPKFRLTGPSGPVELELPAWLVVNEFGFLRQVVLDGLGIGLLLEPTVERDLEARRLRRVLPEYRLDGGALFAVYPSAHHLTPKVRVFIDFLLEKLGKAIVRR